MCSVVQYDDNGGTSVQRAFSLIAVAALILVACDRRTGDPSAVGHTATSSATQASTATITPAVSGQAPACGMPISRDTEPAPPGVARAIPLTPASVEWVRVTSNEISRGTLLRGNVGIYATTFYLIERDELWRVRPVGAPVSYEFDRVTTNGTNRTIGISSDRSKASETVMVDLASREVSLLFPFRIEVITEFDRPGSAGFAGGRTRVTTDGGVDRLGGRWLPGDYELDLRNCTMAYLTADGISRYVLDRPLPSTAILPGATVVEVRRWGSSPGLILHDRAGAPRVVQHGGGIELSPDGLWAVWTGDMWTGDGVNARYVDLSGGVTYDLGHSHDVVSRGEPTRVRWSPDGTSRSGHRRWSCMTRSSPVVRRRSGR